MKTIVVAGGNSGIGLQVVQDLFVKGHKVILLGRDSEKGKNALASLSGRQDNDDRAVFLSVDLSTHDGVRETAKKVLEITDSINCVVHASGVFIQEEMRTVDGLHPFFAVNYLSRYHLTQLLLPALRKSQDGRVIMLTADINPSATVDLSQFPQFKPFNLWTMRIPIQVANHHYAAHLARSEPGILACVMNAGMVKTDILRSMPTYVRVFAAIFAPLFFNTLEQSAHNVVEACVRDDWPNASYWSKPGDFEKRVAIVVDEDTTRELLQISKNITGA